jgi:mannose-6-phosphate isomerase-like protein (cupin superfamily)
MLNEEVSINYVIKPWGHEYRLNLSENLCITYLIINSGSRTSLHCHPEKLTSLVCINGEGRINFLNNSINFGKMNSFIVRTGLFHQIENISNEKLLVLEFENPNDKDDLIRFSDDFGRQHQPYENEKQISDTNQGMEIDFLKSFGKLNEWVYEKLTFRKLGVQDLHSSNLSETSIFSVMRGRIFEGKSGKTILRPGDSINGLTLNKILDSFQHSLDLEVLNIIDKERNE